MRQKVNEPTPLRGRRRRRRRRWGALQDFDDDPLWDLRLGAPRAAPPLLGVGDAATDFGDGDSPVCSLLACRASRDRHLRQFCVALRRLSPRSRGVVLLAQTEENLCVNLCLREEDNMICLLLVVRSQPLLLGWRVVVPAAQTCAASLLEQHSRSRCRPGVSFGCRVRADGSQELWVQQCRGIFQCDGQSTADNLRRTNTTGVACGYPPGRPAYTCSCDSMNCSYNKRGGSWYDMHGTELPLPTGRLRAKAAYASRVHLWEYLASEQPILCKSKRVFKPSAILMKSADVVGNGKTALHFLLRNNHGTADRKSVVRFNKLAMAREHMMLPDVHVVNRWVSPRGNISINLECSGPSIGCNQTRVFTLVPRLRGIVCRGDPSRGFLFVSLFQHLNMTLHGFDDDKSHYMDNARVWHNAEEEHKVLRLKGLLRRAR